MSGLYASPLRVYLCLAMLAFAGLFSGYKLPISLFPNSSKPVIWVKVPYGNSTPEEFLNSYGRYLEDQFHSIQTDELQVEKLRASYDEDGAEYNVEFKWGSPSREALKEVETVTHAFGARLPSDVRDSINIWSRNDNGGFFALSYYSESRSLDEIHDILEPQIAAQLSKVQDAGGAELWNPAQKEVRVELIPERMAALRLLPVDIGAAIERSLGARGAGSVTIGTRQLTIQMPRFVRQLDDLGRVLVPTPSGRTIHLADVATIDFALKSTNIESFKTSGAPSIILFARPRAGGNVKRMSEDILKIVESVQPKLPKDIQYRVLVDPSEFVRGAIANVFHEVGIGAFLAVLVLFLFIGSFRNTVTAAIEIPLSMILAFILMKFSGMNLNLISLGGLALSAGMNVDASVVVMENIFRHFEELKPGTRLSALDRLRVVIKAVSEVRFSVIASTIASLVVFLPLAFTSDLSYAILGDLAKTVVFSHGLSAFVALILVPTVRLHLMAHKGAPDAKHPLEPPSHSPVERQIKWIENTYASALGRFVESARLKWGLCLGLIATLGLLVALVLPRLPKEIIGMPDTDWIMLFVNTKGNTLLKQMDSQSDEVEAELLSKFGTKVLYTFTQVRGPNRSQIMVRLKNKSEMMTFWKNLESHFTNTPFLKYQVFPWNPAELPIPDPPQLKVVVRGGTLADRAEVTRQIESKLDESQVFPRVWAEPEVNRLESVVLRPNLDQWPALRATMGESFSPSDLADLARVATVGRKAGSMTIDGHHTEVMLHYPEGTIQAAEDLGSMPIGVGSKIIPLKALSQVGIEELPPTIYREDQRELFIVVGRKNQGDSNAKVAEGVAKATALIDQWKQDDAKRWPKGQVRPSVVIEDAQKDLHEALRQLGTAVALSILLIFLTLVVQFGSFMNALLVLVAVPLGFIGVILSLFVFQSTLNSVLGVILLNGIAVANSIILVDFLKRLVDGGMDPARAAVEAGRRRLRPILITSLTTILGMLPIAIGMGEGGRILQPLGIAVSGGLWVSMGLTLFIVPALQVAYLQWSHRRSNRLLLAHAEGPREAVNFFSGAVVADEAAEAAFEGALPRAKIITPGVKPPEFSKELQ